MKIGFIGAGKVGFSLGRYFVGNGLEVSGYYCRNVQSSAEAAKFTGTKFYDNVAELVKDSDVIFIVVPDGAITENYYAIRELGIGGKQLCHCSGALSAAEAFPDIRKYGAEGCSVHPLFPISSKYDSHRELKNAFFCIEGDEAAAAEGKGILDKMGNPTRLINESAKSEYHAACAVSSNLVCALAAESLSLMGKCGFSEKEALSALEPLIISNIRRILAVGPAEALTGPVERNDVMTVRRHLECIEAGADREMYRAVSRKLVDLAQKKHPDSDYTEMRRLLK